MNLEIFFMELFLRLRCKWFGHKWESRVTRYYSPSNNLEAHVKYYVCKKCSIPQSVEEYKINERESKINQILD